MSSNGVVQKPSETALFAALRRTLAHKEFNNEKFGPDNLAEYFLPPHFRFFLCFKSIRSNTKTKLDGFLPGLTEYMIARTAYFDHLFVDALRHQFAQIVLLGAGYDTRAYRFAALNKATRIFELDAPPTQNRKIQCLKRARIDIPKQVKFVPINFNTESLEDVLKSTGYQESQKTLFIWEGVSYYLDAGSVDATLEFASRASHPESRIAFDYTVTLTAGNAPNYYGAEEFTRTMRAQHTDEELLFSIDEGKIDAFFEHRGLKILDHLNNEEIESSFLQKEDGSLLGRMTGHFRFAMVSTGSQRS